MRKLLTAAFVFSSLLVAPGIVVTSSQAQQVCGPDVPASWNRPGGFCDQMQSGKSLSLPGTGDDCSSYEYVFPEVRTMLEEKGARVHMAVTCTVDCSQYEYEETSVDLRTLEHGDRARVADVPLGCQA